jgi:hypothetical protein
MTRWPVRISIALRFMRRKVTTFHRRKPYYHSPMERAPAIRRRCAAHHQVRMELPLGAGQSSGSVELLGLAKIFCRGNQPACVPSPPALIFRLTVRWVC